MLLSLGTMRISSWNVRGIKAPDKHAHIKQLLDACGVDIFLLQEMKTSVDVFESSIKKWIRWESFHSLV